MKRIVTLSFAAVLMTVGIVLAPSKASPPPPRPNSICLETNACSASQCHQVTLTDPNTGISTTYWGRSSAGTVPMCHSNTGTYCYQLSPAVFVQCSTVFLYPTQTDCMNGTNFTGRVLPRYALSDCWA